MLKNFFKLVLTLLTFCFSSMVLAETIAPGIQTIRPFPSPEDVCLVVEGTVLSEHAKGTVIACPTRERGAIKDRKNEGAELLRKAGNWTLLELAPAPDVSDLTRQYMGLTLVYFDRAHGTQVEYFGKSGVFLWYPGNVAVLPGGWKIGAKASGGSEICFRYHTNTFNPVTGKRGGDWECQSIRGNQEDITHRLQGDPFNLRSGEVPFIYKPRKRMSLTKLANGAGIKRSELIDLGRPK